MTDMRRRLGPAPPCARGVSACGVADRWLGAAVETVAAGLVLVEIVILFAGVIARYVFHRPLVWSDELASILFLWLSMLGAVVALRRGEHMRMTALVSHVAPEHARVARGDARSRRSLAFLVLILRPAFDYASEESLHRHPGAGDQQRLARRGDPGRHRR